MLEKKVPINNVSLAVSIITLILGIFPVKLEQL